MEVEPNDPRICEIPMTEGEAMLSIVPRIEKLGIDILASTVIRMGKGRLPQGWTMQVPTPTNPPEMSMHRNLPAKIFNERKEEVARFQGRGSRRRLIVHPAPVPTETRPPRNGPKGNIFTGQQSKRKALFSKKRVRRPKTEVFVHDENFANVDIDEMCLYEPSPMVASDKLRTWNNYLPGVDCKHIVTFDVGKKFKDQKGKMSCNDLGHVVHMSLGKWLCKCREPDEIRGCYKRRRIDEPDTKCVNVTEEDDRTIKPMERHCLQCWETRVFNPNNANDCYNLHDSVRIERLGFHEHVNVSS